MNFLRSGFSRVAKHDVFEYVPRYVEDEKEEKSIEERIRFEKGKKIRDVNTLSKRRDPIFSHREKLSHNKKWRLLLLLTSLIGTSGYLFSHAQKGWPHFVFPLIFLLILLVLFIRTNNQR